jgi:8-oxo-dGTP pyrophosphatase MutT (NUDIX family)
MRWRVHGERFVYDNPWMRVALVDVEIPDGPRFEHHVLRATAHASGCAVVRGGAVLLIWRHRFTTDTWGWELPAGRVDPGETPEAAAVREAEEEAGWRPVGPIGHLLTWHPVNGIGDHTFHAFMAHDAIDCGGPSDPGESERIAWVPLAEARQLLRSGQVLDGLSVGALGYLFAFADDLGIAGT